MNYEISSSIKLNFIAYNKYHTIANYLKSMYDIFLKIYKNKGDYTMTNLQNQIENYLEYCGTRSLELLKQIMEENKSECEK